MKKILSLAVLIGILGAGNVAAFDWFGGRLSIGGGYGRAKPKLPYSYQDTETDGPMWTVHGKYFLSDRLSLVASYAELRPRNKATGLDTWFRPIIGSVRYNLFKNLPITPYVTAGGGVSLNKKDIPGAPAIRWEKLALQGGVGFEFFINQGTSFGAEALYHNFVAENHNRPYRLISAVGTVNVYFGEGPATAKARDEAKKARADADRAKADADRAKSDAEREAAKARDLAAQNQDAASVAAAQAAAAQAEADRKAQELQAQVTQAQTEINAIKEMVSRKDLKPVNFKTGSAELLVESHAALDKVAEAAKKYPNLKLRVEGHTDSVGSYALNQTLSQKRADSVREYLVSQGVPAEQMTAAGFGETRPVGTNDSAEGRAQNRRVEFIFFLN